MADTSKTRPATFNLDDVNKIVAEALAKQSSTFALAMADMQAKAKADKPQTAIGISQKNDLAAIRAFKKAGFKGELLPRINILTFNKWLDQGRRPAESSKSLKVNGLRLFHISQTRELTKAELAAPKEPKPAKSKGAKVIPISGEASPPSQ